MATVNYNDLAEARFGEDLHAVAKPAISDKELSDSYKFYGVKTGKAAGKTDSQLYKQATKDILSWWKKAKAKGYYQTTKAGTPVGAGSNKPPTAPLPTFGMSFMRAATKQYGITQPIPDWAKRNQDRFNQWLSMQMRRKGMTL